jgi:uncharacterized protein (TIGR02391 family)
MSSDAPLLDSQRRELEAVFARSALRSESFAWTLRDASWAGWYDGELEAVVINEKYEFRIEYHDAWNDGMGHHGPAGFQVFHTPGVQSQYDHKQLATWSLVQERFALWLRLVARELGRDDVVAPRSVEEVAVAPYRETWALLHPEIRELAKPRFEAGHFADAVEASLKHVNDLVKRVVREAGGTELDGADLMRQAFSVKKPYLQLADLRTESGRNEQQGYMEIFAGTMTGVRNPKAHANVTITPERAMHLLTLASLLRHKLEEATGVR